MQIGRGGRKKPTQENLVKISQVLGVSIDYLVGSSEDNLGELDNIELLFPHELKRID